MKEIKNFEELYQVNELGQIWSIKNKKYLKQTLCKNGYLYVGLHKNKIRKNILVHRIVAEAFIPNPKRLPEVNHIDGNKQNNSVDNLEWCTRSQNTSHAFKTGLRNYNGCKNPHSKLTQSDVETIRRIYVRGKHCENNSYGLAKRYNVSPKTIQNVVNGKHY